MRNKDAFSGYHLAINFLYFALVLLFSMCLMHPMYLAISLTGALAYDIHLKGRKAVRFAVMGLLPMALRFIPKFKAQMQTVSEAQACIGRDTKNGSVFRRVGNAVKIFSIMVTWSLENAIETADSMRSRGWFSAGRISFPAGWQAERISGIIRR